MTKRECTCGHMLLISHSLRRIKEEAEKLLSRASDGTFEKGGQIDSVANRLITHINQIAKFRERIKPTLRRESEVCICTFTDHIRKTVQEIEKEVDGLFKSVQAGHRDSRSAVGDATLSMQGQLKQVLETLERI